MRTCLFALFAVSLLVGCNQPTAETSGSSGTSGASAATGSTGAGGSSGASSASSASGTSTGSTGATGSSSGTAGSSSGGSSGQSGDCASDADCPGSRCAEITAGGFRACVQPVQPPEACSGGGIDPCCPDGPVCPDGAACVLGPVVPVCGGVVMPGRNQCAVDQCGSDADCSGQAVCAPAGTMGLQVRACVFAGCKRDADCTEGSSGRCEPVADPCCGTVYGLRCIYAGGCRSNADCGPGDYCEPSASPGASCQPGAPACPL